LPIATPLNVQEQVPLESAQNVIAVELPFKYSEMVPVAAAGETDAVPVKEEPSMMLVLLVTFRVVVVESWAMLSCVPLETLVPSLLSPP
jgi:hypothetical protein